MDWLARAWRTLEGYEWALFFRSPGFGGVAVLVASLIALRGVAKTVRAQREANEDARASALKEQWWSRARWALDLILSDREAHRDVGFSVLVALASSEYAAQHETEVIDAALDAALTAYLEDDSTDAPGVEAPPDAESTREPGGQP